MGYEGNALFGCVYCPVCTCCKLPPDGSFTVGETYTFEYSIDARKVTDNLGEAITFSEPVFLSCFDNQGEAVTSFIPVLQDDTQYHIYLVLAEDRCNIEEIRAYAKVKNVNYLKSRQMLIQKRNLIAAGYVVEIFEILDRLALFHVHYEIEPEFPYDYKRKENLEQ